MVFQERAGNFQQHGHRRLPVQSDTAESLGERNVDVSTDASRENHLLAELKHLGKLLPSGGILPDPDQWTSDEFTGQGSACDHRLEAGPPAPGGA